LCARHFFDQTLNSGGRARLLECTQRAKVDLRRLVELEQQILIALLTLHMKTTQLYNVDQTHRQQRSAQLVALGGGEQRLMLGIAVNESRQLAIQTTSTFIGTMTTRTTTIDRIYKKIELFCQRRR
jgi:hypothetical protein